MKVGGYEVLKKLGEGSHGRVYLARRSGLDDFRTYYALKRLRAPEEGDESFEHYVLREARLGGLVNHRSIVRIHEVLRVGGEIVLVMDYVEGVTLRCCLSPRRLQGAALPREVSLEIAAELLEALHAAHTLVDPEGHPSGFVHRDIKPANIMLTSDGGLKLMDFGVARTQGLDAVTQTGELRGTIAYMAPEQAAGRAVSPATDQFAVGLVLLEMLTAAPAWGEPRGLGILGKVVAGDVAEGLVRLQATDPVASILMRMLQPEPEDRYGSAEEAAAELRGLRAQVAQPPTLPAFARQEIQAAAAQPGSEERVPSWTHEEAARADWESWGTGSDRSVAPPQAEAQGATSLPRQSDPHATLPLSGPPGSSPGQQQPAPGQAAAAAAGPGSPGWSHRTLTWEDSRSSARSSVRRAAGAAPARRSGRPGLAVPLVALALAALGAVLALVLLQGREPPASPGEGSLQAAAAQVAEPGAPARAPVQVGDATSEVLISDDLDEEIDLDGASSRSTAASRARPVAGPAARPSLTPRVRADASSALSSRTSPSAASVERDDARPGEFIAEAAQPGPAAAEQPAAEESAAAGAGPLTGAGPTLRFVSERQQPLGAPLSLRVRADHFDATAVAAYYQWRSEGRSGRRKRDLRRVPDGSFALDIPSADLRADRLQLWFIAQPGGVKAGGEASPIEVKVR